MKSLDLNRILMNDLPFHFLLEVGLRTMIMFVVILVTLRASGKRGIKQLSVFELVLIIGLGSAAGDPMFYEDVGLLPAFTVFTVVIMMYILITKLTDKVRWAEKLLEGKPEYLMKDGRLLYRTFKNSNLSRDELFSELRLQNVEHLGQVKSIVLETSGEFSVLFYDDDDIKPGLPIFPGEGLSAADTLEVVCNFCGQLSHGGIQQTCPECKEQEWRIPFYNKRIS
ncbi:DUF421 domain-containing protein [Mucilaginibacter sp. UR6-1]|uniref:DUF421 domain-containing protein n=1 Tax=Mucilaginibacter sp. UR6-1 TaxID=1435643 RepID=UPI001E2FB43B|nr:YetF domain-containing protein [Mucilaginibacter sp. UR6-1]MCC8410781.1 DUF421 domain-containing protein [Mucilaginibacter sp. UR6-1]